MGENLFNKNIWYKIQIDRHVNLILKNLISYEIID